MSRFNSQEWIPRTSLGKMVLEGRLTSLTEIFNQGYKIQEPEIIDTLIPDLQQEVLDINLVQKQTDAGEKSRFKALVVVGNYDGLFGLGVGKAKQVRAAIQKATIDAKLNIVPVKRGCGSWECGCRDPHSIPFQVVGKCGSVRIQLLPAPRGLGVVAGETAKKIISFVGVKDCWSKSYGSTRTVPSFAYATYDALKNTYKIVSPLDWQG
ncbi:MAG: 30S ribosomal protein S5 [Candidatus Bathyarchaeota archaeon]|jgi:small subunit ribosomal protein S5|nr:30S ribosomal protein S5 [Candidatus Bathyarchaeota archaeon]